MTKSTIADNGKAFPLGVFKSESGVNFSVFSDTAKAVNVSLFDQKNNSALKKIPMSRTGDIWHTSVAKLSTEGLLYAFEVDGVVVSDPYARSLATGHVWGKEEKEFSKLAHFVFDVDFDWQGIASPDIPMEDLIIYEMHVRALTQDPSSKVSKPGGFLGVIEKIPYLKQLGINAIELLPVFEFNECSNHTKNPKTGERLYNFWGYSTYNFFAPMQRFATNSEAATAILEFKTMVRELHKNGIEIILDVVYNHTAEGGESGPVYSFKKLGQKTYYHIDKDGKYRDFSGCGNSMNCNHPVTAGLIVDSLRYWVEEMHVDGFRFDLASIMTRNEEGEPDPDPFVVRAISQDPILSHVKLIAEAWDCAGLYQVGSFPSYGIWAEWNGKYRDRVRRFIKGTDDAAGDFSKAICGSQDIYGKNHTPYQSINFVTAHDGFTLNDLVTYQQKNNLDNAEENRDGANDNENWNCGVEGLSDDPKINALRERQQRNFLLALCVSIGTPMFFMGDEYQHTRFGNNNGWCQDNANNWFLWDRIKEKQDFFQFYCNAIAFRKKHSIFKHKTFFTPEEITWHGIKAFKSDWSKESRFVAYTLNAKGNKEHSVYIAFNSRFDDVDVELPPPPNGKKWHICIDTTNCFTKDAVLSNAVRMTSHSALVAEAL